MILFRYSFLLLLTFIVSCASKTLDLNVQNIDIRDILESIERSNSAFNRLEGLAKVKAIDPFESISFNQVTLLDHPDRFRLEALAVFGQTVAVVISDGQHVYFKTPRESIKFDDSRNFNLSYFYTNAPSELKTAELIDILLGKVPFGLWSDNNKVNIDFDGKLSVSYINKNGTNTTLNIEPLRKRVISAEVGLDSKESLIISYLNHQDINGFNFPRTVKILYSRGELIINYDKDILLNSEIDSNLFVP